MLNALTTAAGNKMKATVADIHRGEDVGVSVETHAATPNPIAAQTKPQ
jgi:hypothetical protein